MDASYDPKGHGRQKTVEAVAFHEAPPPDRLHGIVHRYLEVRTEAPLAEDYRFHAVPDACVYTVLDQSDPDIAGITRLSAASAELNLGRRFHYTNIRFLPGVWNHAAAPVGFGMVDKAYDGDLPLLEVNRALIGQDFAAKLPLLSDLVDALIERGLLQRNPVTETILQHLDEIHTVADMADLVGLSPRQLQRVLKRTTALAPHDFLKVLRLQQSLAGTPSLSYADQSHFIHSFRTATGYTPGRYAKKFDV